MERFNRSSSPILSPRNVMLAVIVTWLSSSAVADAAENGSSILNALSGVYTGDEVFAKCTCVFATHRTIAAYATLLKVGDDIPVNVDFCPTAKQVECDLTRYSSNLNRKYSMRALVWYSKGPAKTRFKVDNTLLYYAVQPSLEKFQSTLLQWDWDAEYFYAPSFLGQN